MGAGVELSKKITADELRKQDAETISESEERLREELSDIRMHAPLGKQTVSSAQVRGLKRNLARLLTIRKERSL